jgi:hypothetical protein
MMGISILIYEISPYEQFLWKELPWLNEGYLYAELMGSCLISICLSVHMELHCGYWILKSIS